jgi:cytochrome c oxidase cbb3-type subunit 3
MRNKSLITVCLLFSLPVLAQEEAKTAAATENIYNIVALCAIAASLVLFGIVSLVLLNTFKVLSRLLIPEVPKTTTSPGFEYVIKPVVPKVSWWQKALSLKPLSEEKDMLIEHSYDGIRELDNPIPGWFNFLFYGSIIFGIVYLLHYHVFKTGKLQDEEYVIEMKEAEEERALFLSKSANMVDEHTVTADLSAETIAAGKALYTQSCTPCHGAGGEGTVGPNLTDNYWIHGGDVKSIFKTIKYGVPDKGMIAWEKQLSPKQIAEVSNYIISLKGTNPPNPKAPQGIEEKEEMAAE